MPTPYERGIGLFNDERFWDAHEAWEEAWKHETDPQRRLFLQGIIQVAAALVHWQRGNGRGIALNWAKARAKLAVLGAAYAGLALPPLIAHMDHFAAVQGVGLAPPVLSL